ncbi:biotin synthesis protein BioC [Candidatus Kinetoplastibacterium desouzaii TCC079E]|uniref:Malonyl-[acyl-carrier protein] O-methyltransferase n=1 Tax=Candidatus Kinetoplastidibacterium desouzai TCC079E TaxID=1208919 RepID=M1LVA2_9PROT|nr:methyltransferase domain-containing protein [Candidatus Kinetoplastibacterium desouzaii]AGF47189.1 biotin synthesis protein BioC [Candidatus Kinetoplastibacterium desouzaii TCC079E]
MKNKFPLPINQQHVIKQFSRRHNLAKAQFLYANIATKMIDNLKFVHINPETILDVGCGSGDNSDLLKSLYKKSYYIGLDNCETLLQESKKKLKKYHCFFNKLLNKKNIPKFIQSDMASSGLETEYFDLIWSNLALHWHPQPQKVFLEWYRLLKNNGLLMFSCFGPNTIKEVRLALQDANLETKTLEFIDMHDYGDMLVEYGFTNPVMNQETLNIFYKTPQELIKDIYCIGGNPSLGRKSNLTSKEWLKKLYDALEKQKNEFNNLKLTIEIIYGHAWRHNNQFINNNEKYININSINKL